MKAACGLASIKHRTYWNAPADSFDNSAKPGATESAAQFNELNALVSQLRGDSGGCTHRRHADANQLASGAARNIAPHCPSGVAKRVNETPLLHASTFFSASA
jgi:hypothetical protein